MEQFKRNTEVVLSCMKDNGYHPAMIRQYERMYQSLSSFLFSNGLAYEKETYEKWQQSDADGLDSKYPYVMDNCIDKLSDVYEVGTVLPEHMPHRKFILLPQLENEINEYLHACKGTYSESQQCNIKARCTAFMRFLQNRGLTAISDLGYEDILAYHADVPHKERVGRILLNPPLSCFFPTWLKRGDAATGWGGFSTTCRVAGL